MGFSVGREATYHIWTIVLIGLAIVMLTVAHLLLWLDGFLKQFGYQVDVSDNKLYLSLPSKTVADR